MLFRSRYQTNRSNQLNPLQSLMGASQTATNAMGQAGQNYANQAGEAYMGAGNARASGYVGSANAWSNALGGANNALNQYGAQQAYNARTNAMYGGGMGGGVTYGGGGQGVQLNNMPTSWGSVGGGYG